MAVEAPEQPSRLVHDIIEQALVAPDSGTLWFALATACARASGAELEGVYVHNHSTRELRQVLPSTDSAAVGHPRYVLGQPMKTLDRFAVGRAARKGVTVVYRTRDGRTKVAVPLRGRRDWDLTPFAVVSLTLSADAGDPALGQLEELLTYVWPISTLAALDYPHSIANRATQLDAAIESVLHVLCDGFGFEFATVSVIDDNRHKIRTLAGPDAPWIADAQHVPDSDDIQAKLIRDQSTRVVTGCCHPDLDPNVFRQYEHEDLVRVFIPIIGTLQPLGIIEAGYRRDAKAPLQPSLLSVFERWVSTEVARTLESALLIEHEQRYAVGLTTLHELSYQLQIDLRRRPATTWLRDIVEAGRTVLHADLILLYLWDSQSARFSPPIQAGELKGRGELAPAESASIVNLVRQNGPLYISNVSSQDSPIYAEHTFAERQAVASFAGLPLVIRGETLGVVCINFSRYRPFGDQERRVIELYGHQAAALIAGDKFARKRMEFDLHDLVKTKLSAVKMQTSAVMEELEAQPGVGRARELLDNIQNYCDEIFSNVNTILDELAVGGSDSDVLRGILERSIERLRSVVGPPDLNVHLGAAFPEVPLVSAADLVYFIDQAVSNARQHARASVIQLQVYCTDRELHATVQDDGVGFELNGSDSKDEVSLTSPELRARHFRGLASMAYRSERLGGQLRVRSRPGLGTTVSLAIPLARR